MQISEFFYSLQGEGKRSGYPSFFIRTNYCNLRCLFSSGNRCDTPYTSWTSIDSENLGELSVDMILDEYKKYNCYDIVITGGEPTLYPEDLYNLCKEIKSRGNNFITLETNGTHYGKYNEFIDLISLSPKLKSSSPFNTKYLDMHESARINPDVLKTYNDSHNHGHFDVQWKFVITGKEDISEILELQKEIGFKNSDVYLMPEGITPEELSAKREIISGFCKEYKFNYTDRLQILIWGNKRGT